MNWLDRLNAQLQGPYPSPDDFTNEDEQGRGEDQNSSSDQEDSSTVAENSSTSIYDYP
jgi:hypothetical protein